MTQVNALFLSLIGIVGILVLAWWLSRWWIWGQRLGVTMLVLILGVAVRNGFGWQPDARISAWISGPLTSLAIAELLLAIRLKTLVQRARPLLLFFGIALLATLAGVLIGALVLVEPLREERSALMGLYTATFSGGSLNLVAVGRILNPPDALLALATAADQIVFTLWFGLCVGLGRRDRPRPSLRRPPLQMPPSVAPTQAARFGWLLALIWGLAVVLLSDGLTQGLAGIGVVVPSILVLTTVAVVLAQAPGLESRQFCSGCGQWLIQPFFVVVGLGTPLAGVLTEGAWILVYAAIVVGMHGVVVLLLRWRCRLPLAELLVASQAAIGGPSTALALATAIQRDDLAVAGVALGLLGYGVGTYLGVAMAALPG